MKRLYYLCIVLLAAAVSCSKSNEADLDGNNGGNNGGNNCDTVNMKFAANIKPILQNNCYACHSNANFSMSGVKLEDYADVKEHADDGELMGTITHAAGFPAMPQGGSKLSDCNINKIRAWINRGAEDN
jgi:cytochrome c5